jgi:drug/metabolite transporter (DMT)-like permease
VGVPVLRLLGGQLAIGAAAIFARFALGGAGPIAVSALRLAIAALVALAIARRFERLSPRRELAFAIAGIALAIHFATWIGSLAYTSVAVSTLLVTTTPIWTEAYDSIRFRRAPTAGFGLSLVLALTGVAAIAFSHTAVPAPVAGHALFGDGLALLGSIAIGAYLIIVRDAGTLEGATQRLGTRQIVARTYGWAAIALVAAAFAAGQGPPALRDATAWAGILAMALVSQLLGHTALNAALRDFTPSVIALTTLLEPIVAAILAAVVFRETLSWQAAAGGIAILSAVGSMLAASTSAAANVEARDLA